MRTSTGRNFSTDDAAATGGFDFTEAFEKIAHEAQEQMGPLAQNVFFVGDGLQRAATDIIFDLFRPQIWQPSRLYQTGSGFIKEVNALLRLLSPREANLAWQELTNKIDVFTLVKNLDSRLGLASDQFTPLPELVQDAYGLSAFEALWGVEGVGHNYASSYWRWHGEPRGLLFKENADVPFKSLTMLHAGMGLAFADLLVGDLTTESPGEEVRAALEKFVDLCKNNSRRGYLGAAIESLGLVTRDFYPDLLKLVAQEFRAVAPDFMGFFWHGAGRALYFSRQYFLPVLSSLWSGIEIQGLTQEERLSALSGRIWASTLVNMRHPAIVENMLRTYVHDATIKEAFANAVSSCITMRWDTTPEEPFVRNFYSHHPSSHDPNLASLWQSCVATPARLAVETYHSVLNDHDALEQVFRYQDLASLVEELRKQSPAQQGQ